jgi:hypothetical protein
MSTHQAIDEERQEGTGPWHTDLKGATGMSTMMRRTDEMITV